MITNCSKITKHANTRHYLYYFFVFHRTLLYNVQCTVHPSRKEDRQQKSSYALKTTESECAKCNYPYLCMLQYLLYIQNNVFRYEAFPLQLLPNLDF